MMINKLKNASILSTAILLAASGASWAGNVSSGSQASAHWNQARQISKDKQKLLVKEAIDVVMETENALEALNQHKSKDALLKLNGVSAKLRSLLAKDSQLKLLPVSFQEQAFVFEGSLEEAKETAKKANEFIEDQRIQQARQLLDRLASEIRINMVELPLGDYTEAIEKAAASIVAGKQDEARDALTDVLDTLITHAEVYPLPVLSAEADLTEAYELEHKADLSKSENKEKILALANKAESQLKLAEALGYGEKKDYAVLYEGVQALRDTLHTDQFKATWAKLNEAIGRLKEKIIHSAK